MQAQLEFTFPTRASPSPSRPGTRRRLRMAALALLCGGVGFGIYGQLAQNGRLDAEVSRVAAENARLQRDIDESHTEIVLAQTPAWLEEQARKLGYVLPGERVFVLTPPGAAVPAKGGVNAPLPSLAPTPTPAPTPSPTPTSAPVPPIFQLPTPSPR